MILAHMWLGFCLGLCHKIWQLIPLFPCEAHREGHLGSLRRILFCSRVGLLFKLFLSLTIVILMPVLFVALFGLSLCLQLYGVVVVLLIQGEFFEVRP